MHDNEKLLITREIIEKEISLKRRKNNRISLLLLIPIAFYFVYYTCTIIYRTNFSDKLSVFSFIFFTLVGIIIVTMYFYNLIFFCRKAKYKISIERLHHKREEAARGIYSYSDTRYKLYFVSGLMCNRPEIIFFDINNTVAFNEASAADEFFVVKSNKKVFCIFNTRYFELEEALQKELLS